jgi:hypothetical protein
MPLDTHAPASPGSIWVWLPPAEPLRVEILEPHPNAWATARNLETGEILDVDLDTSDGCEVPWVEPPPAPPTIERVFEPSHLRRGRLATSPVWKVTAPDGARWRFHRKKDAQRFIDNGCVCPNHKQLFCDCGGSIEAPTGPLGL